MGRPKIEDFKPKIYTPHEEFVGHIRNFLHLLTRNEASTYAGREIKNIRRMKNHYLKNLLFPAMANLTFFFEAVSIYRELQDEFESDIKELLGIRRLHPKAGNYAFMFDSLITGIISTNVVTNTNAGENDFRLKLTDILQALIFQKLQRVKIMETKSSSYRVFEDIMHAKAWTEMLASRISDEYNFRKLRANYDQLELKRCKDEEERKKYIKQKDEQAREDFEKDAQAKSPSRTFNFDTKKLLEKKMK